MDDKQRNIVKLRRTAGEAKKYVVLMRVIGLLVLVLTVIIASVVALLFPIKDAPPSGESTPSQADDAAQTKNAPQGGESA